MAQNGQQVQFTPVNTGNLSEIPPDLPAGEWSATCSVKKAKTSKDSFPMLILEWKTTESNTDGNENHVGGKAADFLTFFPSSHRASRMTKLRLKKMCDALGVDVPSATKLESWDDIGDFIAELDGCQATIWTAVETDKESGEQRTKILYAKPGAALSRAAAAADDDDEEEEEEKPVVKKLKKKVR